MGRAFIPPDVQRFLGRLNQHFLSRILSRNRGHRVRNAGLLHGESCCLVAPRPAFPAMQVLAQLEGRVDLDTVQR